MKVATMDSRTFSISNWRFRNSVTKGANWKSKTGNLSSLGKLKAFTRALLSVFLSFLNARVPRDQTGLFQRRAQVAVIFNQSASNAVTDRAGLTRWPAACYVHQNVEFICCLS